MPEGTPPAPPPLIGPAATDGGGTGATGTAGVIHWLDGDPAQVALGGKAGPLARLAAAGLPVPPGFVVASSVFPPDPPAAGASPARLAPDVQDEVRDALAELGRRDGGAAPLVAVRSSATTEDLATASFAGQYLTFLGVREADEVLTCAAACWASLWAPHAVAYREHAQARTDGALPPPAMAVLVQVLVDADAAGVAFTADPITGDPAAVAINGAWGLGQSVVDGAVEADFWQVDRRTRRTLRQTTGRKPTRSGIGPGAERVPVPEAAQGLPCLTPEQLDRVVELALRAEAVLDAPVDVEWAVAGDRVWLLQARPITTGAPAAAADAEAPVPPEAPPGVTPEGPATEPIGPSPAFPFRWPDADAPGRCWSRRGQPAPLRPLAGDVALAFGRGRIDAATIKGDDTAEQTLLLNGHAYSARVPAPGSEHERTLRKEAFERTAAALHERGETYLQVVVFPELDEANTRLGAVDPAALGPAALADHLEGALRWFQRAWTLHWLWGPDGPRERFARLYAEVTGDQRPEAPSELLLHEPNLFTDAVDGLVELARIAQRHAPLRRLLVTATPAAALDALRRGPETPGGAAFGAALDRLLDRQGLRCGAGFGVEHEEMLPGWREDPALVLALVRRYVEQDLDALLGARAAAVEARDRRASEVRAGIAGEEGQRRFDFWLGAARRAQQGFEDHNYKIDSAATSLLHLAITGCARRLAGAGCLSDPAEIWFLHAHEVALALRGLAGQDEGPGAPPPVAAPEPTPGGAGHPEGPDGPRPPHWRALVAARVALHHWQCSLTPPERVGAPPPAPPAPAPEARPDGQPARLPTPHPPPGALLTGRTGAAGVATGRVRLVGPGALVPDVEPGDVLVAHNAGPLWAAVFPAVAAVVLDEGVFFQHAMLTCREYGVPALFQTGDATRRLREGQRVTVDATRGCVLPADPSG